MQDLQNKQKSEVKAILIYLHFFPTLLTRTVERTISCVGYSYWFFASSHASEASPQNTAVSETFKE